MSPETWHEGVAGVSGGGRSKKMTREEERAATHGREMQR